MFLTLTLVVRVSFYNKGTTEKGSGKMVEVLTL